ncbi:hypothetical protein V1477_006639 [Vespula maculifrons]|uniref:Uncharacterized protein n=1 Tax=Vespula maculifrons TaxID=7453 RepID=A0ABD2CJF4_VESMC
MREEMTREIMSPPGKSYSPVPNFKIFDKEKLFSRKSGSVSKSYDERKSGHIMREEMAHEIMSPPGKSYSPVRNFKIFDKERIFSLKSGSVSRSYDVRKSGHIMREEMAREIMSPTGRGLYRDHMMREKVAKSYDLLINYAFLYEI